MGTFKKGLFLGGLLGAGLTWLATTKKGKEVREQMLDHAAEVYTQVKNQLMNTDAFENLSKNKYVSMVKTAVDKYAIDNGLAENVKKMMVKVVSAQWNTLQAEVKKRKK